MKYLKNFKDRLNENINWENYEYDFDITLNQWGNFEMGDGESFGGLDKENADFFCKTVKNGDVYETTFVPNPFNPKDTSDWDDQDQIDMYKGVSTYYTKLEDVINYIKENDGKFGIYEIKSELDTIIIDDMMWYYLGLHSAGKEKKSPLSEFDETQLK